MATASDKNVKTFSKASSAKEVNVEPIKFNYYGVDVQAKRNINSLDTLRFFSGIQSDDDAERLSAVLLYLEKSFDTPNRKILEKVIDNPENDIDVQDLVELMNWLSEERSDRPTKEAKQ